MGLKDKLKQFVANCMKDDTNENKILVIANLTEKEVEKIKQETGIELNQEYQHIIDKYAVKHTFRKHGNDKQEALRGQVGVKEDDFEKIEEILENPDKISHGGQNNIGNDIILNEKTIDNQYFYAEEVRTKRKQLAMQTLYIRKKKK
ncbi:MAG: hypothetical protein MUE81_13315 [Thermoflexibacter sp.]|jgi:hypothetical protein|nr:hypothetical protein [Thermoflexibacter sp.]